MEEPFAKWGLDVIKMLAKAYGRVRRVHRTELARIGDHFGPPDELARYYVEPQLSEHMPSRHKRGRRGRRRTGPILQKMKEFFEQGFLCRDGPTSLYWQTPAWGNPHSWPC